MPGFAAETGGHLVGRGLRSIRRSSVGDQGNGLPLAVGIADDVFGHHPQGRAGIRLQPWTLPRKTPASLRPTGMRTSVGHWRLAGARRKCSTTRPRPPFPADR